MSIYKPNGDQKDFTLTADQMAILSYAYKMALTGNSDLEMPSFSAYDLGYLQIYLEHRGAPIIKKYFEEKIYPLIDQLPGQAEDKPMLQIIN